MKKKNLRDSTNEKSELLKEKLRDRVKKTILDDQMYCLPNMNQQKTLLKGNFGF